MQRQGSYCLRVIAYTYTLIPLVNLVKSAMAVSGTHG
jgi:hypothetical protein